MRRATWTVPSSVLSVLFQSTLSMRRATRNQQTHHPESYISIHALHEESDPSVCDTLLPLSISIHALHEESDPNVLPRPRAPITFQSTLSMRRATVGRRRVDHGAGISIHALHEESDPRHTHTSPFRLIFQSTLSMRRATAGRVRVLVGLAISIHALHEESDSAKIIRLRESINFNPRSP